MEVLYPLPVGIRLRKETLHCHDQKILHDATAVLLVQTLEGLFDCQLPIRDL